MVKKLATDVEGAFVRNLQTAETTHVTLCSVSPIAPFIVSSVRAISTSFFIIIDRINLDEATRAESLFPTPMDKLTRHPPLEDLTIDTTERHLLPLQGKLQLMQWN
jgi:hypothetical protein